MNYFNIICGVGYPGDRAITSGRPDGSPPMGATRDDHNFVDRSRRDRSVSTPPRARGGLALSNGQEPTALRADWCVVGLGRRTRRASRRLPMRRALSPEACPTWKCGASARSGARRRGSDRAFPGGEPKRRNRCPRIQYPLFRDCSSAAGFPGLTLMHPLPRNEPKVDPGANQVSPQEINVV
jgi:hypothetical protein